MKHLLLFFVALCHAHALDLGFVSGDAVIFKSPVTQYLLQVLKDVPGDQYRIEIEDPVRIPLVSIVAIDKSLGDVFAKMKGLGIIDWADENILVIQVKSWHDPLNEASGGQLTGFVNVLFDDPVQQDDAPDAAMP
jgi:hypothetical protein